MELTRELRELAKFTAGGMPVISVYLDTQWRDQHQREVLIGDTAEGVAARARERWRARGGAS